MKESIRRRGTTWTMQHEVSRAGKRTFLTKGGFKTKREAQAALTESLSRHARGEAIEPSKNTVAVYLRDWITLVEPRVKPSTHRSYSDIVAHRLVPHLGDVRLSELRPASIARCYAELRTSGRRDGKGGLSETSLEHTHRVLHSALEHATRSRLVARNVSNDVVKPRRGHVDMKTWSPQQLRAFLDSTRSHRLHPLFLTAGTTAMRRGEVLGLRWEDVDLEAARLSVRRNRVAVGYQVLEGTPKTRKGVRVIDLDPETVATLRAWRRHRLEERLAGGPTGVDSGLVFVREDGTGLHPHAVADAFERALAHSGVPAIRFHDLRHTWASLALQAGVSAKVVSERLGHASISITLDTYTHVLPAMQADTAAQVAGLIFGPQ
ncbi:MAG: tyrosine-type recombinase/integrase [Solirubrobacterales bacterium]